MDISVSWLFSIHLYFLLLFAHFVHGDLTWRASSRGIRIWWGLYSSRLTYAEAELNYMLLLWQDQELSSFRPDICKWPFHQNTHTSKCQICLGLNFDKLFRRMQNLIKSKISPSFTHSKLWLRWHPSCCVYHNFSNIQQCQWPIIQLFYSSIIITIIIACLSCFLLAALLLLFSLSVVTNMKILIIISISPCSNLPRSRRRCVDARCWKVERRLDSQLPL